MRIMLLRSMDLSTRTAVKNILTVFLGQKWWPSGNVTFYRFISAEKCDCFPAWKSLNFFFFFNLHILFWCFQSNTCWLFFLILNGFTFSKFLFNSITKNPFLFKLCKTKIPSQSRLNSLRLSTTFCVVLNQYFLLFSSPKNLKMYYFWWPPNIYLNYPPELWGMEK